MSYRTPRSRLLLTVAFAAVLLIGHVALAAPVTSPSQSAGNQPATDANGARALRLPTDSLLSVDMNRIEIVDKIMAQWKGDIGATDVFGIQEKLKGLRADRLLAASLVGSFDDVLKILVANEKGGDASLVNVNSRSADRSKAVGDTAIDLTYTPITPKRMVDTRGAIIPTCIPGGGVYTNGETRTYTITVADCVPAGASAIQVQLYAAPPNGQVVDVFADKQGGPLAAVALEAVGVASGAFSGTGATIPVNTANNQFSIKVVAEPTQVVIDVVGYFIAPSAISIANRSPLTISATNYLLGGTAITAIAIEPGGTGGTGISASGSGTGVSADGGLFGITGSSGPSGVGVLGYNRDRNGTAIRAIGNIQVWGPAIDFASATRQMIQLYGGANQYGIGVQSGTQYYRISSETGNGAGFAWYRGGVHSDAAFDPGAGGVKVMTLSRDGELRAASFLASSDRALKFGFAAIDAKAILAKVAALPITSWAYNAEKGSGVRHIGPMSQDFKAAFNIGGDDKSISLIDSSGVALTAIKGLHAVLQEKDAKIAKLERQMNAIKKKLGM